MKPPSPAQQKRSARKAQRTEQRRAVATRKATRKAREASKQDDLYSAVTQTRRADDFENTTDDNPAVV